jgi:hypothetical protein
MDFCLLLTKEYLPVEVFNQGSMSDHNETFKFINKTLTNFITLHCISNADVILKLPEYNQNNAIIMDIKSLFVEQSNTIRSNIYERFYGVQKMQKKPTENKRLKQQIEEYKERIRILENQVNNLKLLHVPQAKEPEEIITPSFDEMFNEDINLTFNQIDRFDQDDRLNNNNELDFSDVFN